MFCQYIFVNYFYFLLKITIDKRLKLLAFIVRFINCRCYPNLLKNDEIVFRLAVALMFSKKNKSAH
jgi:hypothetical protein